MDVSTLKSKIKSNTAPDFLIFTGDEIEVQRLYINQYATVRGQQVQRIDSISEVYKNLRGNSFISIPMCYVVRDDKEFMQTEKLQEQIDKGVLKQNSYILQLSNVDKRTKFYNRYKDKIVEFDALPVEQLKKQIANKVQLTDHNANRLIDICEQNYGRLLLEVDKIARWAEIKEIGHDEALRQLLADGTIYQPAYDAIFDLVDSILLRKNKLAFNLLEQCYTVGEATMVMLSVLYTNAKAVLQVQNCGAGDIAKSTGLTGWQINNAKAKVGKWSNRELVNIMATVQQLESGIKKGEVEESIAMDYLLTSVL